MAESLVLNPGDENRSGLRGQVFEILKTVLQADTEPPPSRTIIDLQRLIQPTPGYPSQSPLTLGREFFLPFHAVAWQIPYEGPLQGRIIRILGALKNEYAVQKVEDGIVSFVWEAQHCLDEAFAETYDSIVYTTVPDLSVDEDIARRVNFHSYAARLMGAGLLGVDKYCIYAFADALEGQFSERSEPEHVEAATMVLDVEVRVAIVTEWIRHAAKAIYRRDFSVWGSIHGPLITWDEQGFSANRWSLWKSRLSMVEMNALLSEDIRVRAGQAVQTMNEVEAAAPNKTGQGF